MLDETQRSLQSTLATNDEEGDAMNVNTSTA